MLNPHIRSALLPRPGAQPGVQPRLCMARQLGCASGQVASRDQGAITGISGFAFQGTNAHVVMTRCQCWKLCITNTNRFYANSGLRVIDMDQVSCPAAGSVAAWRDGSKCSVQDAKPVQFSVCGRLVLGAPASLVPAARPPPLVSRCFRAAAAAGLLLCKP